MDIGEERERIVVEPVRAPLPSPEREPVEEPTPEAPVPDRDPVPA